jgi:glycogen debranching enzyme
VNQYWKDSWNSVLFADGRRAEPPIATCDVQGYTYDALRRTARLARVAWGDDDLAGRLEARAADLRRRFNRDFWSDRRGHFVLALDGRKRQVDSLTSNAGHVLWSGIADEERAAETVRRLMRSDVHSGWGLRTMSALDGGYNPISYHDGTVWPHDSGIVAEGFRRYGFRQAASTLVAGLLDAAPFFHHRLPEAFAGYGREENPFPVEYPTASRPQGWSAGAPLLALRTLLGLDAGPDGLTSDPAGPDALWGIRLSGIRVRGGRESVGQV